MLNATIRGSESFKFKIRITGKTPDDGNAKNVEIVVPFLNIIIGELLKCH